MEITIGYLMFIGQNNLTKNKEQKILNSLRRKISYDPTCFGFMPLSGDGKYVRVCIIDSGLPNIHTLNCDENSVVNFTNTPTISDDTGHATAIAGLIKGNQRDIIGLAPKCDLYFAKAITKNSSSTNADSVVDAILWSIVKDVDIILMSFGTQTNFEPLHDAIKKAYKSGISMIAASGNNDSSTKDVYFPARYSEVFSVGYHNKNQFAKKIMYNNDCYGVVMPDIKYVTTYLDNKFIEMQGSSMAAATVAGLAALTYQNLRRRGINPKNPQILYKELSKFVLKEN